MQIEDIAVSATPYRNGLTDKLAALGVGQSVFVDTTYQAAYQCIRQAKFRRKNPLSGSFRVVVEGSGVRVGRTA